MRMLANLGMALLAGNLPLAGAELNARVLKLIGPDAQAVFGADVERYHESPLERLFPLVGYPKAAGTIHQFLEIRGGAAGEEQPLVIWTGSPHTADEDGAAQLTMLDASTAIWGDPAAMETAMQRWNGSAPVSELAGQVRRLSAGYDNWFLLLKPLARGEQAAGLPALKYRNEVTQAVEQIRGGIRLGAFNDVLIEIVTRTADQASALAALGKWLPGLLQLENPGGVVSLLVDSAENISVSASGTVVSLSFTLPGDKVEQLTKGRPQIVEQ